MSQGVTFELSSTHDHHTTDNDHATSPNDHTQDLQANTTPIPAAHKQQLLTTTQNGNECPGTTSTALHQDPRTRTGAANTDNNPPLPRSIDNGHQSPTIKTHERGRAFANTDNNTPTTMLNRQRPPPLTTYERCSPPLPTNSKPPNNHRTMAHNPSKPTGDEERPAQPAANDDRRPQTQMTTTTTLNRIWPLLLPREERRPPSTMNDKDGRSC